MDNLDTGDVNNGYTLISCLKFNWVLILFFIMDIKTQWMDNLDTGDVKWMDIHWFNV